MVSNVWVVRNYYLLHATEYNIQYINIDDIVCVLSWGWREIFIWKKICEFRIYNGMSFQNGNDEIK